MVAQRLYGLWTWSRWWAGRRYAGPGQAPPSPAHRLHQRPLERRASAGGSPTLSGGRRLPCVVLGSRVPWGRRVRGLVPVT